MERQSASWDIKNALRNYSTLVITQGLVAFFSFASVWVATRFLGAEGYGGIVAIIVAAQFGHMFIGWTTIALARFGIEEFVESGGINKSFWARTLILLPNTLILFVSGVLWLPFLLTWLKLPLEAVWYIIPHFLVTALWMHVQQAVQGAKLPHLHGVFLAVERALIFLGLLILIGLGKLTYLTAILAYIIAPLLMTFAGLYQIRKFISWRIEIDPDKVKKILKFSIPLIPFSFVGYLSSNHLDAFFIIQYLSKADLGIYSVAYQINGILMQFPTVAGTLLLPLFITLQTGNGKNKVNKFMEEILPLLTFLGGLIVICLTLPIGLFVPIIFGEEMSQATILVWILISSTAFALPSILGYAPYTNAKSATYIATVMAIIGATTNVAGNLILIPLFGLLGSAWATVLAYGVSCLSAMIIVRWHFSVKQSWIFPAILPVLVVSGWVSWTGEFFVAVFLSAISAILIFFVYQKTILDSIRLLKNYRNQ